jgi:hypothetical protein
MIVRDGPTKPRFPLALIHPLGPLFRLLPLSLRRHLLFVRAFGKWGNFRRPRTFREKAQWRTINDRRVRLAFAQDKLAAKEYLRRVAYEIGEPMRIPETLWVGRDIRELEALADRLPARWVLKPNHSAGRFALLDAAARSVDWTLLRELGNQWMRRDEEELVMGHWAYGQARHLLIAEERIGDHATAPNDFKVSTFDGVPGYFFWADRSHLEARYAFYLPDGTPFSWGDPGELRSNAAALAVLPPQQLRQRMLNIASAAAAPFDWIRVDFYVEGGEVWFGELTLYGAGGLYVIDESNNARFGALWNLPDLLTPDPREAEWRALLQGTPKGTLQR